MIGIRRGGVDLQWFMNLTVRRIGRCAQGFLGALVWMGGRKGDGGKEENDGVCGGGGKGIYEMNYQISSATCFATSSTILRSNANVVS